MRDNITIKGLVVIALLTAGLIVVIVIAAKNTEPDADTVENVLRETILLNTVTRPVEYKLIYLVNSSGEQPDGRAWCAIIEPPLSFIDTPDTLIEVDHFLIDQRDGWWDVIPFTEHGQDIEIWQENGCSW